MKKQEHDWWRMNSSKDTSGDIDYCRNQGVVKARKKGGHWVWRKACGAKHAITIGHNIINSESVD